MSARSSRWVHLHRLAVSGLVVGLLVLLPSSSASFNASASNADNSYVTDTLDPPTNVAGTSGTSATVGWTQTVDSYADGYRVLRSSTSGGPYTQVAQVTPVSASSYVDAAAEGRYYYVTRAFAEGWESANSGETTARVWRPFSCPSNAALRACLQFDTNVSGSYLDGSGNGNHMTHVNGSQVEGITDMALKGGSASAQYTILDSASLDFTTALTIEFWLRMDSLPSSGRVGIIDNDGQWSVFIYAGTGMRCSNGPANLYHATVPTGTWVHVACTWNGSTLALHYNGTQVASMASTGTIDASSTTAISVLDESPGWTQPADGAMDNLRIWSEGRTPAQICADNGLSC